MKRSREISQVTDRVKSQAISPETKQAISWELRQVISQERMGQSSENQNMTSGVIWKEMVRFALPVASGALFQGLYSAVDAVLVGKFVGTEALSAVGGSSSVIIWLLIGSFVCLANGSSVVAAQFYGAEDQNALKKTTGTSVMFYLTTGVALSFFCEAIRLPFLEAMHTPQESLSQASAYLSIYFLSAPFMLLTNAGAGILQAVGDSRTPFIFGLVSSLMNIILDILLVVVYPLGVEGAAWATTFSQAFGAALILYKLTRPGKPFSLAFSFLKPDREILFSMLRIGIPTALINIMYDVSSMFVQSSLNTLGTAEVAAWTLSMNANVIPNCICEGMLVAAAAFSGQNYGAKKPERIRQGFFVGLRTFLPAQIVTVILTIIFAPALLRVLTEDKTVQVLAFQMVCVFLPFTPARTVIELESAFMRGCNEVKLPTRIQAVCICGFRILWIEIVCRIWHTAPMVTLAFGLSYALAAVLLTFYYRRWSLKTLVDVSGNGS